MTDHGANGGSAGGQYPGMPRWVKVFGLVILQTAREPETIRAAWITMALTRVGRDRPTGARVARHRPGDFAYRAQCVQAARPHAVRLAKQVDAKEGSRRMLGGRSWSEWIAQYSGSHQHPVNRLCHTIGIPLIAFSLPGFAVALAVHRLWPIPTAMFVSGWLLQFIGHAFEGKPPEFFRDWRFLFVGLRWWIAKMRGRA